MKVKEMMEQSVITIQETATIKECGDLLEKHDINGVPVLAGKEVVGVITRADIFRSILPRYPELYENEKYMMDFEYIEERIHKVREIRVRSLMSHPPVTIGQEIAVCKAGSVMILKKIKQIPVVSDNELVGIVTLTDICRNLLQRAEKVGT
jgi:CBS domain-containing protein